MRRPLLAMALLLVAPLACAQVYKWKDAQGTVHYSETPPPAGTHYSQVSVSTGNSGTESPAAPSANASTPASNAAAGGDTAPAQGGGNPPMADTPENRAKLCTSLKANIGALQGSGPVVMQGPGGQQLLNADQRKQQLDASQSQYNQYCSNNQ